MPLRKCPTSKSGALTPQSPLSVRSWEETHTSEGGPARHGARPKSPLRRPVSAIGKAMSKHLDELWDDPTHGFGSATARDRSLSPSRKALRAEREAEAAAQERAQEVARQCFCVIQAHTHPVRSICLGPSYVYTASMDGLIKVWNLDSLLDIQGGKAGPQVAVQEIKAHSAGVSCLIIVDETLLLSGGWDSTAKVWDMSNGHTCLATLKGHSEFVRAVAGMHACMCVCICMYACMHACMHACMYICVCTYAVLP